MATRAKTKTRTPSGRPSRKKKTPKWSRRPERERGRGLADALLPTLEGTVDSDHLRTRSDPLGAEFVQRRQPRGCAELAPAQAGQPGARPPRRLAPAARGRHEPSAARP